MREELCAHRRAGALAGALRHLLVSSSLVLSGALSFAQTPVTVVPPNLAGPVAGTANGSGAVTSSGSASYSIPLPHPPGSAKLEPNISLMYDSRGPDGLLGLGWSISGLSVISRCPMSLAVDGVSGRVGLDANDRYCLDGQRLVLVSGTYGAAAVYRTEVDGISRITSSGSDPAKGPDSWKVETKAGQILTYGGTTDSYVEAAGTSKPLRWAVNRVEDHHGNFFTVEYFEESTSGEHRPTQIRYTGNGTTLLPYAAVRFDYESVQRPDVITRFVSGSRTTISRRLSKVSAWVNTAADGTGGTKVNETVVTYKVSPSSKRSLVDTVSFCGSDGSCLPATTFAWQQRTTADNGFAGAGSGVWGGPGAIFHTVARTLHGVLASVKTADVNGDGRLDLIKSREDGTWDVCLSTGSGFNCQIWNGPNALSDEVITGDFNSDGRTDLIRPNSSNWTVCLSTGTSFDCQTWPAAMGSTAVNFAGMSASFTYLPVDTDGDGIDDVLVRTSTTSPNLIRCRSTGSAFNCTPYNAKGFFDPHMVDYLEVENRCTINTARWSPAMGDFNGDKRTDVLPAQFLDPRCAAIWTTAPNNGFDMCTAGDTATSCSPVVTGLGNSLGFVDPPSNMVADLNGDGYADFVLQGLGTTYPGYMKVCLSTGNGGVSCTDYIPDQSGSSALMNVADVDGDGRPDIMQYGRLCQYLNGSLSCSTWELAYGDNNEVGPIYGDFNGDGKADLAFYNLSTSSWRVALAAGPTPDVLTSVTNGAGHTTQFDYKTINDASVYTAGSVLGYPKRGVNSGMTVVSQMRTSNGLGGWLATDYQYEANRTNMQGRGDLGFAVVRSIDRVRNVTGQTVASQDFPYIGMALDQRQTHSSGTVLSQTTNTPANIATEGAAKHPFVTKSVVIKKDLDGSPLPTVTTTIAPEDLDVYANVLKSTELIEASGETFTTTTVNVYENRPSNWLVGLLRRTSVTKTANMPTVSPQPPALKLVGCTVTSSPTTSPTLATATCTLANTGIGAAAAMVYSGTAGLTATGPGSCAPNTANCGTVTIKSGAAPGTYSGNVTVTSTPAGRSGTTSVSLVVNPSPPSLALSGCSSVTPTVSPAQGRMTCTLSNSGQTSATGVSYSVPGSVSVSGPNSCAAGSSNCGTVTVTTGTGVSTYSGSVVATPAPAGTAGSMAFGLVVTASPPALTLSGCVQTSPTVSPATASMTCTLGNSGQTAASGVSYSGPSGTSVTGPAACAASTANCGAVTVTTGSAPATYSGNLTATASPSGTNAVVAVSLTVNPSPPSLTLTNCSSTTPTTSPNVASMACQLGNSGQTAATSISYSVPAGVSAAGPSTCAAGTANCGNVSVTTGSGPGTYSGTLNVSPTPSGTAASQAFGLTVNPTPPTLTLTGCSSTTPTTSPTAATMVCTLGNTGQSAASGVTYGGAAGTTVAGPSSCAAGTANCGGVTVTTGSGPGAYNGTLSASPTPAGTAATASIGLAVNPTPPALTLWGCSSTTPTTSPNKATMTCNLGNNGQTSATSVSYGAPAGTTVNGPASCAAGTSNCGVVTLNTATSAGTYSGSLTATPTPAGSVGSAVVNLTVNPTPPALALSNCVSNTPTMSPNAATMNCVLSNSGQTAASSVGYSSASGTSVSGPASCAAGSGNCGSVVVTTSTTAGTYSGTLSAAPTPSGTSGQAAVSLTVNPAAPVLNASPSSLSIPTVSKGAFSATQTITVQNTGSVNAVITRALTYTAGITDNGTFSIGGTCASGSTVTAGGGSCTVTVRFIGGCTGGTRQANVTLSGSGFTTLTIPLSGSTTSSGFCS